MSDQRPHVGIGVFVYKDGKFLIGKRLGSHGAGTWSVPGGHLEFGESWEDCAKREVREETGLEIDTVKFLAVANDLFLSENKHSVTIWVTSDWVAGEPTETEPDKFVEQQWVTIKDMPRPRFAPWDNLERLKPELFV